jgi:hypothetical protein
MNLQTKKMFISTMLTVFAVGAFVSTTIRDTSVFEGQADIVEKSLSININDFFYETTVPVAFTTGSTTGTAVTGNNTSTCEIPVSGRFGHTSGDVFDGFRLNDNTLFLRISLGTKKIVGFGGKIYTVSSRSIRLSQNTTPGTSSYVSTNSATYINIGNSGSASGSNVITDINRINISQVITGEIEIRTSGSLGFTEIIIYYTE